VAAVIAGVDPLDEMEAALTERMASIQRTEPLYAVAQMQVIAVRAYRAAVARAERIAAQPTQTLTLEDKQLAPLTHTLAEAAERGVRRYANSIISWRSCLIGGVGIAGLLVGIVATYVVMAREAAAAMDAARIEVPAVFGALPAAEAAAWARLMRDNPPIGRLLAQAQPITTETRGKAVSLAVWVDPPKPATPAAH
jgi:hypothetical protein